MKILHTSDWHLGQNFFTKSRKKEHQGFLQWLLDQVQKQSIDAVIIAGDVFDTGSPPSYAREIYNQFVVDLNRLGCALLVLGGNHDSVSMLNESKALLACLNTHVVANTHEGVEDQVITINDRNGEAGAIVCAVPFVRPRDVVQSMAGESSLDKKYALGEAIQAHYESLYQCAQRRQADLQAQTQRKIPIIGTGHLTAVGVTASESVRDIYIGTLEAFDASAFPPVDYMALGHIHRPQIVAKSESIRYCGSPIPLSFDEVKGNGQQEGGVVYSNKQVVIVEFTEHEKRIQPLSIPLFQPMSVIKGSLESIENQLLQFKDTQQTTWLCIQVEIDDYLSDLQPRIQALTDGYNVEVLQLRRLRSARSQALSQTSNETLSELSPFDVFEKRLQLEVFEGDASIARKDHMVKQFKKIVDDVENMGEAK
ncbi:MULTISPECIES: exonuclease subunit SbcD [Vibrio]|uniref:Nuclease SbcCD subunit D n=1 Tax=Vibrio casei TaxID=673372 RepID=A0A368LH90_9VIBR|nr:MULTISPECIES: exonuclease subunit SbcD [Vibrio]RCS70120.1 exonuclease subunit SbcD [Vibrio casei]SJN24118.1 Exonuclease SbcD [Vibrio casei]HBV77440.1 exonuclease subunit SbcD [Vibrio sp.]